VNARAAGLVICLAGLTGAVAGCGGSTTPSVASVPSTTATTSATAGPATSPSRAAFAACLTAHGFTASVGSAATAGNNVLSIEGVIVSGSVDPSSPQFQAAMAACRKYLPGGGPPSLTPAERAAAANAMLGFAACMRKNGVPSFPDPNGQGFFPLGSIKGIDQDLPLLQRAFKACEHLEPKVGPRLQLG